MGTSPGQQPPYVRNMKEEITKLKENRTQLQDVLNFLFDTDRDWLEVDTSELLKLRKKIKQGSKDESES